MNDDGDYTDADEIMHWVTIVLLALMTIIFLGVTAGFIWAML